MIGSGLLLFGGFNDADAENHISALIAAGGTLTDLEKREVHILFCNLKGNGPNNSMNIWALIDRLWLILGGIKASAAIDIRGNLGTFISTWSVNAIRALCNGSSEYFNSVRTDTILGSAPGMGYMVSQYVASNGSSGCVNAAYTSRVNISKIFTGASYRNSALSNESSVDTVATNTVYVHTFRVPGNTTTINDITDLSNNVGKTAAIQAATGTNICFGAMMQSNGAIGAYDNEYFSSLFLTSGMTNAQALAFRTCMLRFKTALGK